MRERHLSTLLFCSRHHRQALALSLCKHNLMLNSHPLTVTCSQFPSALKTGWAQRSASRLVQPVVSRAQPSHLRHHHRQALPQLGFCFLVTNWRTETDSFALSTWFIERVTEIMTAVDQPWELQDISDMKVSQRQPAQVAATVMLSCGTLCSVRQHQMCISAWIVKGKRKMGFVSWE